MGRLGSLSVEMFCREVGAEAPAPGGGSVAAAGGAMAASLAAMVARLTAGRKKYAAHEEEMKAIASKADLLCADLVKLIDDDAEAFREVASACRMPRLTPEEEQARRSAIERASKKATEAPLSTAEISYMVLNLGLACAERGNTNAASDSAVCAHFAFAAINGAICNIEANLPSIIDQEFCSRVRERVEDLRTGASKLLLRVQEAIAARG
jgi:formiminotetrahydrofolate cyclodeaminase